MYFILLGPFVSACLCLIWLREPIFFVWDEIFLFCMFGFVQDTSYCVCCPGPLGSGAGFRFGTNCFIYGPGPFGSGSRVFCLNQVFGVCGPGPFSSGSRVLFKTKYLVYAVRDRSALEPAFVSERIVLYTVRDRSAPGAGFLFKTTYLVYAVRERLALGACSLFRKNFCWSAQGAGSFSFVWSEILLCMRSGTARLREPFCLG